MKCELGVLGVSRTNCPHFLLHSVTRSFSILDKKSVNQYVVPDGSRPLVVADFVSLSDKTWLVGLNCVTKITVQDADKMFTTRMGKAPDCLLSGSTQTGK